MDSVYAYRSGGQLVAVGTVSDISQATGLTKQQILRRMRGDACEDDSVIDVSPNRRDRRSTMARDLACSDLRERGFDNVQIKRIMGMSKAMVDAALIRVDSGRYDVTRVDEEWDDDFSADVPVSSLTPEKRKELRDMMESAIRRDKERLLVP